MRRLLMAAALAAMAAADPAAAQSWRMTVGVDAAVWDGEAESGPIVHRASKVAFPAELEGFERFRVASITPTDVFVSYRAKDGATETLLSVFLFQPATLPEHRLKGSLAAFATRSPKLFVWAAGPLDVAAAPKLHGYKGMFKTGLDNVTEYLYFYALGDWTVKVRASVSRIEEPAQEAKIDSFVQALPWSAILAANGECDGAACAAPESEMVDGHIVQSTLGPMLASKMKFDPSREAALPVVAKLRGIEVRRFADGEIIYVAKAGKKTYRLVRMPDVTKHMLTNVFGRLTLDKPLYGLLLRTGDKDAMPRLFHGEPSAEALGEAVAELAEGPPPGLIVWVDEAARAIPD